MLVSMTTRCDQCGHESDTRYRFCGMCGAKLPAPAPPPPQPREETVPPPASRQESPAARPVSGPSFLGLADEPASSVTYLLEDELSESHWGRTLVLLLFIAGLAAAGWHWRSNVRAYVTAHLAEHPATSTADNTAAPSTAEAPEPPISASPSEVAPGMATPTQGLDKPKTGAGDVPVNPPKSQATAAPNAGAAQNNAGNAAQSTSAAPQSSTPPAAANSQPVQPASKTDQDESGNDETAKTETPKEESAVSKRAKSRTAAPVADDGDQLEAEGERYLYGTGVAADCNRAVKDLTAASAQGSGKADSVLGAMYATGHCVSNDLPLAYRWFARALQKDPGNARLQRDLQVLWGQMSSDQRQIAMRSQP